MLKDANTVRDGSEFADVVPRTTTPPPSRARTSPTSTTIARRCARSWRIPTPPSSVAARRNQSPRADRTCRRRFDASENPHTDNLWTYQSFCSAHLEEKKQWGTNLGLEDDIFLTVEEWTSVDTSRVQAKGFVGLTPHAIDMETKTAYAVGAMGAFRARQGCVCFSIPYNGNFDRRANDDARVNVRLYVTKGSFNFVNVSLYLCTSRATPATQWQWDVTNFDDDPWDFQNAPKRPTSLPVLDRQGPR